MKAFKIVALAMLIGCNRAAENQISASQSSQQMPDQHETRGASADEEDIKYYPPWKYKKYPMPVRQLIRRADMENGHCRNGRGDDPQTYYACNRRERIMAELEKNGWCWGGSQVGYLQHWLKCTDDPYYLPGGHGPESLFTEDEIREQTQPEKR